MKMNIKKLELIERYKNEFFIHEYTETKHDDSGKETVDVFKKTSFIFKKYFNHTMVGSYGLLQFSEKDDRCVVRLIIRSMKFQQFVDIRNTNLYIKNISLRAVDSEGNQIWSMN